MTEVELFFKLLVLMVFIPLAFVAVAFAAIAFSLRHRRPNQ